MLFAQSKSARCTYGHIATKIWGTWEVLWEAPLCDYDDGYVEFLVATRERDALRFCITTWSYGDGECEWDYEDEYTDAEIASEMEANALFFDSKEECLRYLQNYLVNSPRFAALTPIVRAYNPPQWKIRVQRRSTVKLDVAPAR